MLTIAGAGINLYSLEEVAQKVNFSHFNCLIADINFDNPANKSLIPENVQANFLPFKEIRDFIKEQFLQNSDILYVVTGNPLFFSATVEVLNFLEKEIPLFDRNAVNIIPAESSKDYMLRKLNIPGNEVTCLSLHGRDSLDLVKFLSTEYTFILCDESSSLKLYEDTKFIKDSLTFYIGSKLGSPDEKVEIIDVQKLDSKDLKPYVILIKRNFNPDCSFSNNEDFETNAGMITKTDKRALTLQALKLSPNLLLWDIGAGSGSVSIDAYKIFKTRSILFEKSEQQCGFIKQNLASHKVAGAQLIEGDVLENIIKAPKPDRIFIGGGGENVLKQVKALYLELKDQGILVANIIGLENLAQTVQVLKDSNLKPEIRSIDITNYKKISESIDLSIPEPERTLFQVIIRK